MPAAFIKEFDDLGSITATDAIDVEHVENTAVIIGGTFTGTVSLQISFDGSTWINHPTINGKTAAFAGTVGFRCKALRMNCTAYSSGTIKTAVSGDDEDRRG